MVLRSSNQAFWGPRAGNTTQHSRSEIFTDVAQDKGE
jgi:hypothetical protein